MALCSTPKIWEPERLYAKGLTTRNYAIAPVTTTRGLKDLLHQETQSLILWWWVQRTSNKKKQQKKKQESGKAGLLRGRAPCWFEEELERSKLHCSSLRTAKTDLEQNFHGSAGSWFIYFSKIFTQARVAGSFISSNCFDGSNRTRFNLWTVSGEPVLKTWK